MGEFVVEGGEQLIELSIRYLRHVHRRGHRQPFTKSPWLGL